MTKAMGRGKVLHVCLACFYIDGYAYQENLLPRAHRRDGWEVEILASLLNFNDRGRLFEEEDERQYINEDGIPVRRIAYARLPLSRRLRLYRGLSKQLHQSRPDIIFVHGPQFLDALRVVRYARAHPNVRVFVDNHADSNNSAMGWASRRFLHGLVWRWIAKILDGVTVRFYGVLPSRVAFLEKVYGLPSTRIQLLPLGADDEVVDKITARSVSELRESFSLPRGRKLMVTGGKVDENKREMLDFLRAFRQSPEEWDLAVFGTVIDEYRSEFEQLLNSPRIHWLGWLSAERSMEALASADVVAFAGLHSVMWEQAVAMGKPLMVRRIDGTEHLNFGANILLLPSGSVKSIAATIRRLGEEPDLLPMLVRGAMGPERRAFLYGDIAEASLR
ncbi:MULTISPECIES: glycosyltransferase family 4 protein [Arsenicicoccus]|uniref:glycosyltransferase family 4 protein n=1 Tax=Arsenicicoccus TaxID=267408 RepID=UPI00257B0CBE|nr:MULTISPECIES: glycosyltransferase family 4 protein [Arsenicicoccus]